MILICGGMVMNNRQFEIINNEGMISHIDTEKKDGQFYGETWANICESKLTGKVIDGIIDRYQYKTMKGIRTNDTPTGYIVKIGEEIEAFLPWSCAAQRNPEQDCSGIRIAIIIDNFDPMSKTIVAKELRTVSADFMNETINEMVELIGQAFNDEKYVRGTIIDETIRNGNGSRAGYIVSINGLEAFLPCSLTFFPNDNINHLKGHHILASVKDIDPDKMDIILSMKKPYQKKIAELPPAVIGKETKGILTWVTLYNGYVLLPNETLGVIPLYRYPEKNIQDWKDQTGTIIGCVPYKETFSSDNTLESLKTRPTTQEEYISKKHSVRPQPSSEGQRCEYPKSL